MADETPPPADDVEFLLPRRKVPWAGLVIGVVFVLSVIAAITLYNLLGERGPSIRGKAHVVAFEQGGVWLFLEDGASIRVTDESVQRLGLKTALCTNVEGHIAGNLIELELAECAPGRLVDALIARMRKMNVRFGYWPEGLVPEGADALEPRLATVELYGAMIDQRFPDPQLVRFWAPLFPETVLAARPALPPPVVISIKRNDFITLRVTRPELASLLALPRLVFAGAATKGGWLVRTIELDPGAAVDVRSLLVEPDRDPWRELLRAPIVRASPGVQAPGREGGGTAGP